MNKILNFKNFIKESVLTGQDVSGYLQTLSDKIKNEDRITEPFKLIELLDSIFGEEIFFIGLEDFKQITPDYANTKGVDGIYGAVTFTLNPFPIFVIVDEVKFLDNIYNKTDEMISHIKQTLDHELVHREQYKKIGDKVLSIFSGKVQKVDNKYLENPMELMAYAKQIITELEKSNTKDEILNFLRNGITLSKTQSDYKGLMNMKTPEYPNGYVSEKAYKRLLKYMYQYLTK